MKRALLFFLVLTVIATVGVLSPDSATGVVMESNVNKIALTSPSEGDIWAAGDERVIVWKTRGAEGGYVVLYYRNASNEKWQHITTVTNTGSYIWELPKVETHQAQVRAVWQQSENDDSIKYDECISGEFTIFKKTQEQALIRINSPLGEDLWEPQSKQVISWESGGAVSGGYVDLYYRENSECKWVYIETTKNTGSFLWTVPWAETKEAQIQAVWKSGEGYDKILAVDVSGKFFIMQKTPGRSIKITSPVSGDLWEAGSSQSIKWELSGGTGGKISLYYRGDDSNTWVFIRSVESISGIVGTCSWLVPNMATDSAQIRAIWEADGVMPGIYAQDISDEFMIYRTQVSTKPKTPSDLTATTASASRIKLSWVDESANENGFIVERKTIDGSFEQVAVLKENITKHWDIDLSSATTYVYRIRAYNTAGYSGYSNESTAKTLEAGAPGVVISLRFYLNEKGYYLNDKYYEMDVAPLNYENRTVLPVRFVTEALYASPEWVEDEKKVTIAMIDRYIELWIDKYYAKVDGSYVLIDEENPLVTPIIVPPGRTMLPIRFISENLGCSVEWDPALQEVAITYVVP